LATIHDKQGRHKEALENMAHALRMFRECLPSTHPEIAASLSNIGTFYYKKEQYSKAMSYYKRCFSIQEASLPSHHPDIVRTAGLMKQTFVKIEFCDQPLKQVSYSEICEIVMRLPVK
jgi:tetratricopeptide (TPR) repeat protein